MAVRYLTWRASSPPHSSNPCSTRLGEWGREVTEDLLREELDGFVDVRRSDDVDGRGVDVCGCKSFVV